jgi:subtilisin family serine protease
MRIRTGLAMALTAALLTTSSANAGSKIANDLSSALASGPESVRIIVRAKAKTLSQATVQRYRVAPGSYALKGDALVAMRKHQAVESRKELGNFLAGASVSSYAGQPASVRNVKDLWIVNAYSAEVTPEIVKQLDSRQDVEGVYLDRVIKFIEPVTPVKMDDDTSSAAPKAWGVERVHSPEVWKLGFKGEGVVIGHIDTGADGTHPALKGRILHFKDFTKQQRAEAYDDQGHGTHTAGSIVGAKNGIGVAPEAKLIVAKALDAQGSGGLSGLMNSMQWMLDPDGKGRPFAVNNSWGADRGAMGDEAGMFRDAVKAWVDAGILPLFSSGNSGANTDCIPASYPESFAVGATTNTDKAAYFSSGCKSTWDGQTYIRPDVGAPGQAIVSAAPGGGYVSMDGTSMACPHAAGVVALIKNAKPAITPAEMVKVLNNTALDLGAPGKDTRFGNGLIDALKAVQAVQAK